MGKQRCGEYHTIPRSVAFPNLVSCHKCCHTLLSNDTLELLSNRGTIHFPSTQNPRTAQVMVPIFLNLQEISRAHRLSLEYPDSPDNSWFFFVHTV